MSELNSKIFLDSLDVSDTLALSKIHQNFLGQTTNPSLLANNKDLRILKDNFNLTDEIVQEFYKQKIKVIREKFKNIDISVEVAIDSTTKADVIIQKAREIVDWNMDLTIKLPVTTQGMIAAQELISQKIPINMTLVFNPLQILTISKIAKKATAPVYISVFVARSIDNQLDPYQVIYYGKQILKAIQSPAKILAASLRTYDQIFLASLFGADIVTAPLKTYQELDKKLNQKTRQILETSYQEKLNQLKVNPYLGSEFIDKKWEDININSKLTEAGLAKFDSDYRLLFEK